VVQVIWTRGALIELRAIRQYVAEFSPLAAQRLASRLRSAGEALADSPDRGRPVSHGRRELTIVPPYLIRYMRQGDRIYILELRHGARAPGEG
jgi:plasmid stabilization system protein ParE